ncbi:sensor histidine kinase [Desertivirga brevis]|uniref:sensor histidine kinase n=1 Tax=Desertivirga brevis TaxID=2810310 RepID=UPI001A95B5C5|nr:HAMP domain-containing sensor histidine kinase [Pedobacter sp. SYSU D00873]
MIIRKFSGKKNFVLNIVFLILIAASLVAALTIAYNFTSRYVYDEFERKKTEVVDETIKPYNDFFQNRIPEISLYQGYLDASSAYKFSKTILDQFPFVSRIIFYDTEVSNHKTKYAFRVNNLTIAPKAIAQYYRKQPEDSVVLYTKASGLRPVKYINEFNRVSVKLAAFLQSFELNRSTLSDESLGTFYNVTNNRVTFMNIPREEEIKAFKQLMEDEGSRSPVYQQDVLSFLLDPGKIRIKNIHPHLYEGITIIPLTSDIIEVEPEQVSTEFPLTGAFSSYKLHFVSSSDFLSDEIVRRYFPLALAILMVYGILIAIGFLIYRNLNINNKLFKLQYDFVNNLTHEFKTPVSVIKIAGNNIRRASQLSERERLHYGKILDEEADKLNDLMNKLLSFTQIENQVIKVKRENINLEVFVQNIVDTYNLKYNDFQISYTIRNVDHFYTDPVLLGSLFQNLMDNAYKYSLRGKKELDIDIAHEKTDIVFKFTDKGIGIPKEEMKNIFQKFYRIQSEYNQHGSVGLGLAFCKELVNFMEGNITVRSKVGQGSEFTITLPYNYIL